MGLKVKTERLGVQGISIRGLYLEAGVVEAHKDGGPKVDIADHPLVLAGFDPISHLEI